MNCAAPPAFGYEQANALLYAGWRQGRIFAPSQEVGETGTEGAYWVVCTQSCTIVSPCLIRDPLVEIAEGRPVANYAPKSAEARGKNVRKFHLPIGGADFPALEIDINSRRFVRRDLLLGVTPAKVSVAEEARRNFAGWISRYYTRIALPNELVTRLNVTVLRKLEPFLKGKLDDRSSAVRHEEIASMWIKFTPEVELAKDRDYAVDLMVLCDDQQTAEVIERALLEHVFDSHELNIDGIALRFEVKSKTESFISELDGWLRFTEWDYFSGMGEAAAIPTGAE
jgi:hypothetical protein